MSEQYRAFTNLFYATCGMMAEFGRLLAQCRAYPRFNGLFDEPRAGRLLASSQRALDACDPYRRTEDVPPAVVLQPLYAQAVQLVEELERIEEKRSSMGGVLKAAPARRRTIMESMTEFERQLWQGLGCFGLRNPALEDTPEERAAKLIADFGVDDTKTHHARLAISAAGPWLQGKPVAIAEAGLAGKL